MGKRDGGWLATATVEVRNRKQGVCDIHSMLTCQEFDILGCDEDDREAVM